VSWCTVVREFLRKLSRRKMTPDELQNILNEVDRLYGVEEYESAVTLILNHLNLDLSQAGKLEIHFNSNLAGLLVDVAGAAKHSLAETDPFFLKLEKCLELVVEFFKINLDKIQRIYSQGSANYNYANAVGTLLDYKRSVNPDHLKPEMGDLLNLARKQSLKALGSNPKNKLEVLTNLAHTLCKCSRVVEAVQIYDEVLREDPNFFEALYSRSLDLQYLNMLTSSYSIKMLYEIASGFRKASLVETALPSRRQSASREYTETIQVLRESDSSPEEMEKELSTNLAEFEAHPAARKYYLINGLSLSEHGIYCHCAGASRDNLSILKTSGNIGGNFIPRHEYILNQLKTEFSQARLTYYRAVTEPNDSYERHDFETCLSELGGNERLGARSEELKSSFRQCFGILDRIALGVCELFDFPIEKSEKIYFENFWKGRMETPEEIQRWEKLNSISGNPSLFALYYQSTDLNSKEGEWKKFKAWRNALEHGFFVLHDGANPVNSYGMLDSKFPVIKMNYGEFENKTKDLLGFTRSAIFNYTFCVRREGERTLHKQKTGKLMKIDKKMRAD